MPRVAPTVRTRLIILVLAVILPVIGISAVGAVLLWHSARDAIERELLSRARAVAAGAEREIESAKSLLQALATSPYLDAGDLEGFHRQVVRTPRNAGMRIALSDASGQMLVHSLVPFGAALPARGNLDIVRQVFESGQPWVSDLYTGQTTPEKLIAVDVPVMRDGRVVYDLNMGFPPTVFSRLVGQVNPPGSEWVTSLFDRQMSVVARVPGDETYIGRKAPPEGVRAIAQGGASGIFSSPGFDGEPVLVGYYRMPDTGWVASAAIQQAVVEARLWRSLLTVAAGGGALLLVGLLAALYQGRRIADAISGLSKVPAVVVPGGLREVEEVARSLTHAAGERERSEAALRERDARLHLAFEAGRLGAWEFDILTGRNQWDGPLATLLGFSPDQAAAAANQWLDIIHPEDRDRVRRTLEAAAEGGLPFAEECRVRRFDGAERILVSRGAVVVPGRMVGVAQDVTEIRAAEVSARAALAELDAIYNSAPIGLCVLDTEMRWVRINATLAEFNGLPADAHIGRKLRELLPDIADTIEPVLRRVIETGEAAFNTEIVGETSAHPGVTRAWEGSWLPLRDGAGRVVGVNIVVQEVTEKRAIERALAAERARLRLFIERAPVGIAMLDAEMRYLAVSRRFMADHGISAETDPRTLVGRSHYDLFPDLPERWREVHRRVLLGGETLAVDQDLFERADGSREWIRWEMAPWNHEDSAMRGAVLFVERVTARVTAAMALAESEARLRLATQGAGVGTWELDLLTGQGQWSAESVALLGIERASFALENWLGVSRLEDRAAMAEAWRCAVEQEAPYEVVFRPTKSSPDRGDRWLLLRGKVERDTAACPVRGVGVLLDVTEQRHAEEALRESEARFRASQELSQVAFTILVAVRDAQGQIVDFAWEYANPAALRLLKAETEELRGQRLLERLPDNREHPQLFPRYVRVLNGEEEGGEVELRYEAEGIAGWFRNAVVPIDAERIAVSFDDITVQQKAREALARSHAELEWLVEARTAALLRAADDRRRAEAAMRQSEKLAALGQLAGGIAHDFNNVLQIVQGRCALIEGSPGNLETVRRSARKVLEAVERGASITHRLLAFSRRADLRAEPLDAAALLTGMREMLAHTLGAGVEIGVETAAGLPPLLADKGQLETVLVNLATNARDAMAGLGTLTLAAAAETLVQDDGPGHPRDLKAGSYVRLSVSDTGTGMDAATLARASEPFFTTKPSGEGTGLGLAMARGFAEQSGGGLQIESALGRGTTITLWFPVANQALPTAVPPGSEAAVGVPQNAYARLLVVDDDAMVREVITDQMEAAGYAVLPAESVDAALALLDAGEAVDLLVSDLSMPGMDGTALIREAQRRRPGLPAILLTGFAANAADIAVGGATSGSFSMLRKPVDGKRLAKRVAALLACVEPGR